MASEPAAGQPKKLHPLFTTAKIDRHNGSDKRTSTDEWGERPHDETEKAPTDDTNLGASGFRPDSAPWPGSAALETAPEPLARPPLPANMSTPISSVLPGTTAALPVSIPDSSPLGLKRPFGEGFQTSTATPVLQPKRRGRPPKKAKSESGSAGITGHFVRQEPVAPSLTLPATPDSTIASSEASPGPEPQIQRSRPTQRPVRLLQFNPKTGTIGSPPKPKEAPSKSRPLVVPYGQVNGAARLRIGVLIDAIMTSKCRVFPLPPQLQSQGVASVTKPAKQGCKPKALTANGKLYTSIAAKISADASADTPKETSLKSTHPFFTGGLQQKASAGNEQSNESPQPAGAIVSYTSTPCPQRGPRMGAQPRIGGQLPQFGARSGILRVPGASLPAWPWKGIVHVSPDSVPAMDAADEEEGPKQGRKSKGVAVDISLKESIITTLGKSLKVASVVHEIRQASAANFFVQPGLRLPRRHIESGRKLQKRLAPQLRTYHPYLQSLFESLQTTLSAFDQYQCESQAWTQKYAPRCAAEVLQSGREAYMLRDWLKALKVVSVDTGTGESGKGSQGPGRKKRRKNKLEGFIVSDDDEDGEDGDASNDEGDWSASGRYGLQKKTVVRTRELSDKDGCDGVRLANAIIISGPHGCGKSAAVYAVALELGFEVFELNASSRRSGKDVVDRIGDMTRNHLVQHNKHKPAALGADRGANNGSDDELAFDSKVEGLSNGKQVTMNTFFEPKTQPQAAKGGKRTKQQPTAETTARTAAPELKQSLILLEEADILFEEDKQFWATVMGLIMQSKRPFVITCNDESLLPLQHLRLHGIFRFCQPPTEEAVDGLLAVAASEGHALQRNAVQALYEARGGDLRATLTDLQFWCQIAVGDQRGGFDWFVQRWPDGADLDEEGQVLRAVSEDTYQEGMGWLRHEAGAGGRDWDAESQLVQQAWADWQLDMGRWQDSLGLDVWTKLLASEPQATGVNNRERSLQRLERYDQFSEAMSDADIVSCRVFATGNEVPIDAMQPDLSTKAREDYVVGLQLLERTTAAHENDYLRLPIATALRCLSKEVLIQGVERDQPMGEVRARAIPRIEGVSERQTVAAICAQRVRSQPLLLNEIAVTSRIDFSLAFDPIAVPDNGLGYGGTSLEPSVFDRNLMPIVLDVAPIVRGIIAYEGRLQKQRRRLGTFLSESTRRSSGSANGSDADGDGSDGSGLETGGRRMVKRMRTTRTALSALEGGSRSTTRKERWFHAELNSVQVQRTGGEGWDRLVEAAMEAARRAARETVLLTTVPTAATMDSKDMDIGKSTSEGITPQERENADVDDEQ